MTPSEEKMLLARLEDLEKGAERGKPCFSRFLDPGEVAVWERYMRPRVPFLLWGGYPDAERKMLGFFPDFLEPSPAYFPLSALRLRAKEELGHRTVLGSLMGLGIERNLLGDVAMEEAGPVVFACDSICDYICMNLTKAGHTRVQTQMVPPEEVAVLPKAFQVISGTVASLRLDCVLGLLTGVSRSGAEELLKREFVSVNHSVCTRGATTVASGDVLSVRKFGRAVVDEILGETKKGRMRITLKKYI